MDLVPDSESDSARFARRADSDCGSDLESDSSSDSDSDLGSDSGPDSGSDLDSDSGSDSNGALAARRDITVVGGKSVGFGCRGGNEAGYGAGARDATRRAARAEISPRSGENR